MIFFRLLKDAGRIWLKSEAEHQSAALAYYIPFALTPLLLISISIVGIVSGTERVTGLLYSWGTAIDPALADLFTLAVKNFDALTEQFAVPILAVLFFSSMIFVTLNFLSMALHKVSDQEVNSWPQRIKVLLRSTIFVIVIQAYVLFVIILEELLFGIAILLNSEVILYLKTPALLVSTALLCLIGYSILISRPASLLARVYSSILVTVLFMLAGIIVSIHLVTAPIPDLFGAAGIIFILLIWLYVIATIVLFGAAFARAYDELFLRRF